MRICLVYDCLFPWTIGGAERWYRNLAERLVREGHQVTYLTLRQWDDAPQIVGVNVIAVGPRMPLYSSGKRRMLPPLRFGLGVLRHLLQHGSRYDVVHTASFPYFSLLGAALARPLASYRIVCDWHEVWSREYWRDYLGALGWIGVAVQSLCARVPQKAYAFSRLHKNRLEKLGMRDVEQLTGEYVPPTAIRCARDAGDPPTIVYAGRFIPEKRIELLVDALALAHQRDSALRAQIIGDGPTRPDILTKIRALRLDDVIDCPGFVETDVLNDAMTSALCVVQPSGREGYGMVIVEASHRGVPSVVVAGPDNAATELVSNGENGFVVDTSDASSLASALLECKLKGNSLRRSTLRWYERNENRLSLEASLARVAQEYRAGTPSLRLRTVKGVA